MSISYTWSINQLECYPTYESQTDVVFNVTWSYRGVDSNGVGSSRGGRTAVTYTAGSPFTPFNQLTEAQVLGWITPTITPEQMTEMNDGIDGDISWQIAQASANNPVTPPLPWPQASIPAEEVVPPMLPEVAPPLVEAPVAPTKATK
jgi:hypothetical protein